MSILQYIVLNYRWVFICFYLLPVSVFCDIFSILKNWLLSRLNNSPQQHDYKIRKIQRQINLYLKPENKGLLCQNLDDACSIFKNNLLSAEDSLVDILEINLNKKTVRLEPLVTIGQLTSALLPLGWTIPVVPGIDNISINNLIMGLGVDSSSHKFGLFHDTCISYELILSDGSLVKCSRDENSDLFNAVPCSNKALGLLTEVEIQLIPASHFVRLQFRAYHNQVMGMKKFIEECQSERNDFVEGLLYTESQCVIITGQMVNQIESSKLNEIGKWYKPWFFEHVKNYFTKGFGVEYIPLKDYYHRHTRSTYWELQDIIPYGNNIFFRMFFGWAVPPKLSFFKLTQAELIDKLYEHQRVMLDVLVPADKIQLSIDKFDKALRVYPIWLCPFRPIDQPNFMKSKNINKLYINIGVYGVPKALTFLPQVSLGEIEEFIKNIEGFKIFHGDINTRKMAHSNNLIPF